MELFIFLISWINLLHLFSFSLFFPFAFVTKIKQHNISTTYPTSGNTWLPCGEVIKFILNFLDTAKASLIYVFRYIRSVLCVVWWLIKTLEVSSLGSNHATKLVWS